MPAKILDGRKLADELTNKIKAEIDEIINAKRRVPGLAVILVGDDQASAIYVKHKQKSAENAGMLSKTYSLKKTASETELLTLINRLNADPSIDGILVQLPLPAHINASEILASIAVNKDVDGFHPLNMGKLWQGSAVMRPCTPYGIMLMLASVNINTKGLHAVIVGASNIVGKPVAAELLNSKATVTICHQQTQNLRAHVQTADLLITAAGKPGLIHGSWLKTNAIVLDVGITRLTNGSLVGDVDFASALEVASWITPVPGGVGPMTIAALLTNTMLANNLNSN